ncbi:Uma2 family endonuclease [Spirosoma sp. SC4-14]|uniref:Uma2 family endonuclease n=1 Tax=Spirosoma sp. SC4-14 TaxID=3128900 RepID=UPI0030D0D2CD
MVVEVLSKSTEKVNRGIKFEDYAAHGIQEYWIIDPTKQLIEQYILDTDLQAFALDITARLQHDIASKVVAGFLTPVSAGFDEAISNETLTELLLTC